DAVGAAESAAHHALEHLLQPARLSRLIEFERRMPESPSVSEVLNAVLAAAFPGGPSPSGRLKPLRHAVQRVTVEKFLAHAGSQELPERLRWAFEASLEDLQGTLNSGTATQHARSLSRRVQRFQERDFGAAMPSAPASAAPLPPGSPIGTSDCGHHPDRHSSEAPLAILGSGRPW
ncbi:MAG: hypothetical protein AAF725_23865, partial [Acidobacteriota bacterium]